VSQELGFDPYYKWLGIPPHQQPPTHYRLLGVEVFEADRDVIEAAAERHMAHLQNYKIGPQSELSQKLLNEIARAKVCLLNPLSKAAYDLELKSRLETPSTDVASHPNPPSVAPAVVSVPVYDSSIEAFSSVDDEIPRSYVKNVDEAALVPPSPEGQRRSISRSASRGPSGLLLLSFTVGAGIILVAALLLTNADRFNPKGELNSRNDLVPDAPKSIVASRLPTDAPKTDLPARDDQQSKTAHSSGVPFDVPSPSNTLRPSNPDPPTYTEPHPDPEKQTNPRPPSNTESPPSTDEAPSTEVPKPTIVPPASAPIDNFLFPEIALPSDRKINDKLLFLTHTKIKQVFLRKVARPNMSIQSPLANSLGDAIAFILIDSEKQVPAGIFSFNASGKLDGPALILGENGQPSIVMSYTADRRNGVLRTWDSEGALVLFAEYKSNGKAGITCLCEKGRPLRIEDWNSSDGRQTYLVEFQENSVKLIVAKQAGTAQRARLDETDRTLRSIEGLISNHEKRWKKAFNTWWRAADGQIKELRTMVDAAQDTDTRNKLQALLDKAVESLRSESQKGRDAVLSRF